MSSRLYLPRPHIRPVKYRTVPENQGRNRHMSRLRKSAVFLWLAICCPFAIAPAQSETVILMDGATLLPFGKGTSSLYPGPRVFDDADGTSREVLFGSDRLEVQIGAAGFISMLIYPPRAANFAPGTYAATNRDPWGVVPGDATDWATTDVAVSGRGCNATEGWIKIYEAEFGPGSEVAKLALDFVHWCDSDQAPLFVAIRVNSAIPLTRVQPYAVAGRPQHATEGETVTLDAYDSFSYTASPLAYRWTQVEGPSVAIAHSRTRIASFTAPDVPTGDTPLRFRLTVTDGENDIDTDDVIVHAHDVADPRTRALLHSRVGDPIFRYWREVYGADSQGHDAEDLVQELAETEFDTRAWKEGDFGVRIDMAGSFRPRKDRGIDLSTVTGTVRGMFLPPWGTEFVVPGRYVNTQGMSPNLTTNPFMRFGGFGTDCGETIGAYDVLELEFGPVDPVFGQLTVTKA